MTATECPWFDDRHCRLAAQLSGLPVVTVDPGTHCKVCLERRPDGVTPESPGTVVASLMCSSVRREAPERYEAMRELTRPHRETIVRAKPAPARPDSESQATGPGTELKRVFEEDGLSACQFCHDLAAKMDTWGVAGCKLRIDAETVAAHGGAAALGTPGIVEEIRAHAAESMKNPRNWWAVLRVGMQTVTHGLAEFETRLRAYIREAVLEAIDAAEQQEQLRPPTSDLRPPTSEGEQRGPFSLKTGANRGNRERRPAPAPSVASARSCFSSPAGGNLMTEEDERRRLVDRVPGPVLNGAFLLAGECLQSESLSVVNRNLCLALSALGVEVCAESSERWGVAEPRFLALMRRHLVTSTHHAVQWCNGTAAPAFVDDARLRIAFDMADSWRCTRANYWGRAGVQPSGCDRHAKAWTPTYDLLATGSQYSADVLARHGVPREKLLVVPLGVDCHVFHPGVQPLDLSLLELESNVADPAAARFVFLFLAQGQPRKGLEPLLLAYEQAGTEDTLLLVKCNNRRWGRDPGEVLRAWLARGKRPPVAWTSARVTEAETAALLRRADCLVAPHLVEGFGLVPLQALACGTPVIVSDSGGPREYATAENALLLSGKEHHGATYDIPAGFGYFEPDRSHLVELLRHVAGGADLSPQRAAGLATAAEWTWRRAAEAVCDAAESRGRPLARRSPRRVTGPLISIVIACRDGGEQLQRYFASLWSAQGDYELVIVDDGSDPPLATEVSRAATAWALPALAPCKWLRVEHHCMAAARNAGFAAATGEWICATDCDLEVVDPEWLHALVRSAVDTGAAIAGPALLMRDGQHIDEAGHSLRNGRPGPLHHGERWGPAGPDVVDYVSGAVHLFRAELLDQLGGMWPEYTPTLWDDADFCYHARAVTGRPIVCCHNSRIVHHRGSFTRSPDAGGAYARNLELFRRYWGT